MIEEELREKDYGRDCFNSNGFIVPRRRIVERWPIDQY